MNKNFNPTKSFFFFFSLVFYFSLTAEQLTARFVWLLFLTSEQLIVFINVWLLKMSFIGANFRIKTICAIYKCDFFLYFLGNQWTRWVANKREKKFCFSWIWRAPRVIVAFLILHTSVLHIDKIDDKKFGFEIERVDTCFCHIVSFWRICCTSMVGCIKYPIFFSPTLNSTVKNSKIITSNMSYRESFEFFGFIHFRPFV